MGLNAPMCRLIIATLHEAAEQMQKRCVCMCVCVCVSACASTYFCMCDAGKAETHLNVASIVCLRARRRYLAPCAPVRPGRELSTHSQHRARTSKKILTSTPLSHEGRSVFSRGIQLSTIKPASDEVGQRVASARSAQTMHSSHRYRQT
jgi:hypothetical protein